MTRNNKLLLLFMLSILWSCDSSRIFEKDFSFNENTWHMDMMPQFTFEITDNEAKDVVLKVRNDLKYPFQNLYVTYYLFDPAGKEIASELVNFQLFDEISGKPKGEGNSIYQSSITILEDFIFQQTGEYTLKVAHYMRSEELVGLYSTGLRIEKPN